MNPRKHIFGLLAAISITGLLVAVPSLAGSTDSLHVESYTPTGHSVVVTVSNADLAPSSGHLVVVVLVDNVPVKAVQAISVDGKARRDVVATFPGPVNDVIAANIADTNEPW